MTRARKTLALVRFHRIANAPALRRRGTKRRARNEVADERASYQVEAATHPLDTALERQPCAVRREPPPALPVTPDLAAHHKRLAMKDVDLGFAGRRDAADPLHRTIAALAPGDPLTLRENGSRWELLNRRNERVGRIAQAFSWPPGMRCDAAKVLAVVAWKRTDSEPEYQQSVKCDSWEVVVPELRFVPNG